MYFIIDSQFYFKSKRRNTTNLIKLEMNFTLLLLILSEISICFSFASKRQNVTLQFCCPTAEYFDTSQFKCERIPREANIDWNIKINHVNKSEKPLNVLINFIPKFNLPCEKPEAIYWQINQSLTIKEAVSLIRLVVQESIEIFFLDRC